MKQLLLLLIIAATFSLNAQQVNSFIPQFVEEDAAMPENRTCASADYYQAMLASNPNFGPNRQMIESQTEAYIANPKNAKSRLVVTIPVVVHVLYNLNSQNISDAQIASQIAILNQDFRKLNTEVPNIPAGFAPIAADCEIEFTLAHKTPTGDSTNGITRTYTTTTSFTSNNNMKFTSLGGHDAWDRNQYLNIWVCKLSSGLLGYAQFPGGAAATDGVVISYKAFGNIGTATAPYNKGRTATHEIGHWLNLFHIWGDDGGSCAGSDLVNDTPNQGAENYGCPTFPHVSCSNAPDGDMFMNYMDYSNDACMSMFTTGQKQRMMALFSANGARASLLTSTAAFYPLPNLSACGTPTNLVVSGLGESTAVVTWNANSNAITYHVRYHTATSTFNYDIYTTSNSVSLSTLDPGTDYIFDVRTICSSDTSAYATTTFKTDDPFVYYRCGSTTSVEPNEAMYQAFPLASGAILESKINDSKDVDFYEFATTGIKTNISISLRNMPMDYDAKVYNSKGELIASSQNLGTDVESLVYNSDKEDKYYVKVYGYNGNFSNDVCYNLNVETSANKYAEIINTDLTEKPEISFYPNPAVDVITIDLYSDGQKEVVYNLYNALGQMVQYKVENTHVGQNKISVDVSKLAEGIYMLEYRSNIDRKIQKLTIKR